VLRGCAQPGAAEKAATRTESKSLKAMSRALSELIDSCVDEAQPLAACPILAALETSLKSGRH
jgi:hypothetical protein